MYDKSRLVLWRGGVAPPQPHSQAEGDKVGSTKVGTLLRWGCAVVVVGFFLYCSLVIAYLPGFSVPGETPRKLLAYWPLPILSVLCGACGIAAARLIVRQRVLSWWLLLAVPVPALVTLDVVRQLSS